MLTAALHAPVAHAESSEQLKVLFVGNSLTYYNDMPAMVSALYEAHRPAIEVQAKEVAQPGTSVAVHLSEKEFRDALGTGDFDIVVVQEIGGWPLCPDDFEGCQGSVPALKEAFALTRAAQAKPIWYSTWQANPEAQESLSDLVRDIAADEGVTVADTGAAIYEFGKRNGMDDVLAKDGHPDCLGSWIAAATIANAILDQGLNEDSVTNSSLDSSSNAASKCPAPPDYVMKQIIYAANGDRATR